MNSRLGIARHLTLLTLVVATVAALAWGVGWSMQADRLPWQHQPTSAAGTGDDPVASGAEGGDGGNGGGNGSDDVPAPAPGDDASDTPPAPSEAPSQQPTPEPAPEPTGPTAGPALLSPGDRSAEVRDLQARLRQIDWFTGDVTDLYGDRTAEAVRGFQAKRGFAVTGAVDKTTLDRLHRMTRTPTADELANKLPKASAGNTPGPLDPRCSTGRVLCIDKSTRTLRWVVDGVVRTTVDVRFGADTTPTREGAFKVERKSRDHVSTIYHSSMPYAMFFSGGQAVHYSSDFAARGYNGASHGCVNVRDLPAIRRLFDQVVVGDRVIVYRS